MTDLPEGTTGLEQRAVATRTRLVDTIDALERRGARLVATVNDARRLFAVVVDGAAVLGAVATLLALLRSSRPAEEPSRRHERSARRSVLGHVTAFALLAGLAYMANRAAKPASAPRFSTGTTRLRAIS